MANATCFEPKKHICKFGFELYDYATPNKNRYNILCDLYRKEIVFEFLNKRTEEVVEAFGFKLHGPLIASLLPLIEWEQFEPYRELPDGREWDFDNGNLGYRDGWGYKFWCLSESGYPLFQKYMNNLFDEKQLPPYEKLLSWLRTNFKNKKELADKDMFW